MITPKYCQMSFLFVLSRKRHVCVMESLIVAFQTLKYPIFRVCIQSRVVIPVGYPHQRSGLVECNCVKVSISIILPRSPAFLGSRATLKVPWEWDPKYRVNSVNALIATTSHKRPPPVSDHFVNNRLVSQ